RSFVIGRARAGGGGKVRKMLASALPLIAHLAVRAGQHSAEPESMPTPKAVSAWHPTRPNEYCKLISNIVKSRRTELFPQISQTDAETEPRRQRRSMSKSMSKIMKRITSRIKSKSMTARDAERRL